MSEIYEFPVQILRCVEDGQPPVVECRFVDAWENEWRVIDKAPIFTDEPVDAGGRFPQPGGIRCRILWSGIEGSGRLCCQVDTSQPDGVASVDGETQFDLETFGLHPNWRE